MDIGLITIFLFYALVAFLLYHNRKKIEFSKGLALLRSKKPLEWMDKISKLGIIWRSWGYLGVVAGFSGMVLILWFLMNNLYTFITHPELVDAGLRFVLPGVNAGNAGPVMFVPFWYFIIALGIVIAVHEGCHGIVARAHKIRLKSAGVGIFLVLPLAFVEPDEEQLKRAKLRTKLSVFAAGPFANFCTAALAVLLVTFLLAPAGIVMTEVSEGYPAQEAGVTKGDIIIDINGVPVKTTYEIVEEFEILSPGDRVVLTTLAGEERVVTTTTNPDNSSKAYLGISFDQFYNFKHFDGHQISYHFAKLLYWVFLLNLGIGLVNLLPIGPLDGGRMVRAITEKRIKDKQVVRAITLTVSLIALGVLLLSFAPAFL